MVLYESNPSGGLLHNVNGQLCADIAVSVPSVTL